MLPECFICIGAPLMCSTEVVHSHVSGEASQKLYHPQHKEHV